MNRDEKKQELDSLKRDLEKAKNLIVSTFSGLTVEQDYELRKQIRSAGGKYRVVKNTLAEIAAQGTPHESALQGLTGPTSIAFTEGDPVALAKALTAYAKNNPAFVFKAGVVEGRVVALKDLADLATLPSREELISKLMFLLNAPAQRLATVVGAVARNLAVVVNQAAKENKFSA
jgi:large subunit ribosomal protein L10